MHDDDDFWADMWFIETYNCMKAEDELKAQLKRERKAQKKTKKKEALRA